MQMKLRHISNNYFKTNNAATVNWLYISQGLCLGSSSTTIFSPQSAQASNTEMCADVHAYKCRLYSSYLLQKLQVIFAKLQTSGAPISMLYHK